MAQQKTRQTDASVQTYLDAIDGAERREDCEELARLMSSVTGAPPRMWGTGIVGFGTYHYRYESGHEGDACLTGFASRKGDISIYAQCGFETSEAALAQLGKHKRGKACLYVRRLADIDMVALEKIVAASVAELRRRYP